VVIVSLTVSYGSSRTDVCSPTVSSIQANMVNDRVTLIVVSLVVVLVVAISSAPVKITILETVGEQTSVREEPYDTVNDTITTQSISHDEESATAFYDEEEVTIADESDDESDDEETSPIPEIVTSSLLFVDNVVLPDENDNKVGSSLLLNKPGVVPVTSSTGKPPTYQIEMPPTNVVNTNESISTVV